MFHLKSAPYTNAPPYWQDLFFRSCHIGESSLWASGEPRYSSYCLLRNSKFFVIAFFRLKALLREASLMVVLLIM